MVAVPWEPGDRVDASWLDRMRVPYASRACHRGLLDAPGLGLPLALEVAYPGNGPVLVHHVVPTITLGWYLVTTVLATEDAVLPVEGTYAEHGSGEVPFPVRWA